jgi:hypothetical protein
VSVPTEAAATPRPAGDGALVKDGLALTAGTLVTAGTGMLCWLIAARLMPRAEVGAASEFVNGMLLVAGLAELALGPALLRWLPMAGARRRALLVRAYAVILSTSLLGSVVFLLLHSSVATAAARSGGYVLFVLAAVGWTFVQFKESVLPALGRATAALWVNCAFSVGRLLVLLVAASALRATGVVVSWVVPTVLAALATVLIVFSTVRAPAGDGTAIGADVGVLPDRREVFQLLVPTYVGTVFVDVLYNVVPLTVTARFGTAAGAVFFVAWMTVNAIDVASVGFVNSLVVRIAHEPLRVGALVRLAAGRLAMLFLPAILLGILLAGFMLTVFGHEYAQVGADLLRLLLLGYVGRLAVVLAVGVHLAQGGGLRVALLQGAGAVGMLVIVMLIPVSGGLTVIGVGFIVLQFVLAILAIADLCRRLIHHKLTLGEET